MEIPFPNLTMLKMFVNLCNHKDTIKWICVTNTNRVIDLTSYSVFDGV